MTHVACTLLKRLASSSKKKKLARVEAGCPSLNSLLHSKCTTICSKSDSIGYPLQGHQHCKLDATFKGMMTSDFVLVEAYNVEGFFNAGLLHRKTYF